MCGKKGGVTNDKGFKSWKQNVDGILNRNKSQEAGCPEKVWFRYVKLELVRHANGNFQQILEIQDTFKEKDHIRNV